MGWVIRVEHSSVYRYGVEVAASYNEARMTPMTTDRQVTVESRLEVTPWVRVWRYIDYWGSVVDSFDIQAPHAEMRIAASSVVETSAPVSPPDGLRWAAVSEPAVTDRWAEFLAPTGYVPVDPELAGVAATLRRGDDPVATAQAVVDFVSGKLTYTPGVTDVMTSAPEAFAAGHGVCQDYVHVTLALLRSAGIPARYVSGYLHPKEDAMPGQAHTGESHAWVEAWLGDWWPWDPTNGVPAGHRHVIVGRGRDYADVAPLKGIYSQRGEPMVGTASAPEVQVRISRLA
jgi:transglutaminase-like putative cysteine protease